jgi:iron(III) transport system substrate-binding protein
LIKPLAPSFFVILLLGLFPTTAWPQGGLDSKLIEGAKKEKRLVHWTTMTLSQSKQVVDTFQKKYPFIEVDLYRTGGDAMLNKIFSEDRAGKQLWDVILTRGDMFLPLMKRKLLAPYRSPETNKISTDLLGKDGYWTGYYVNPYVLGYNTKWVKKEEVPKTYEELLDPKWKGQKISVDNTSYNLLAGLITAWGKDKAIAYFKKLAAQEPSVMRGDTNRVQLAAAGEFPLIISFAPIIQRATSEGAPIDWVPLEPVSVQVNPLLLGAKSAHPNAAKLFIDFALSEEGQKQLVGLSRIPVREDVKPQPARLFGGYKRIVENPGEYENFSEVIRLYQEIFNVR